MPKCGVDERRYGRHHQKLLLCTVSHQDQPDHTSDKPIAPVNTLTQAHTHTHTPRHGIAQPAAAYFWVNYEEDFTACGVCTRGSLRCLYPRFLAKCLWTIDEESHGSG
ncbi:unnamed protein product [Arctogadus glacialis]